MKAPRTARGRARRRVGKLAGGRERRCENCDLPLGPVAGSLCLLCLGQPHDIAREGPDAESPGCGTNGTPARKPHASTAVRTSRRDSRQVSQLTEACPDCGQPMVPDGGCFLCRACGYSPCR